MMNDPRSGRGQRQVTYFLNFLMLERVKLDTSFSIRLSGHSEYYTTDAGCPKVIVT